MEDENIEITCRLLKGREGGSPFADEVVPFLEEGLKPVCEQYFDGLVDKGGGCRS